MKYILLIYSPESAWSPEEWTACTKKSGTICQELAALGQFIGASPLHPVATAATIRARAGIRQITTGPFAETTEQLGGYFLIDVDNLDQAIALAVRLPAAYKGTIEIRPIRPTAHLQPTKTNSDNLAGLTQFMMLCYLDEQPWEEASPQVHAEAMQQALALAERLNSQGHLISAAPLHSSSTATTVRIRDGKRLITDGPFAETREVLGGYYLLWAKDQAAALTIAADHPGASIGAVEVRPVYML